MTIESSTDLELARELPAKSASLPPITGSDVATLLDSKILVAGAKGSGHCLYEDNA